MKAVAIINKESGSIKSIDHNDFSNHLVSSFENNNRSIEVQFTSGDNLINSLENAALNKQVDTLIACGGDGTVSAAAAIAVKYKKNFGLLPGGTLNLYARTLGVSFDLYQAVEELASAEVFASDIASANNRYFVHQYSVGLQPRLIEEREKLNYSSRLTKMLSGMSAIKNTIFNQKYITLSTSSLPNLNNEKVGLFNVANNPYGKDHLPYADEPDAGTLAVYWTPPLSKAEELKLMADVLLGRWNANKKLSENWCNEIKLKFISKKTKASIDGELIELEDEVLIKKHPGALQLLIP